MDMKHIKTKCNILFNINKTAVSLQSVDVVDLKPADRQHILPQLIA